MAIIVRIQEQTWAETLSDEGEPVLLCRSALPEFSRIEERARRRLARCYVRAGRRFQRQCRERLFPRAQELRRTARERSRPFEPWEVSLTFSAGEPDEAGRLSLTLTYERRAAGETLFFAQRTDCWDLRTGLPAPPPARDESRSPA